MISSPGWVCLTNGAVGPRSTRLDDLAAGDAEILLLEIGAPQSRRLLDPPARAPAAVLGRTYLGLPSVSAE